MATDRQVQANRANAKYSSGPRSERGKRAVALNAIKHGLSMPLASALGHPDGQDHPELQVIAELIAPECTSPGMARHIASTILEFERNEIAQREFFMSCCVETQGLPAGAQLAEAVRQHYPEYDMLLPKFFITNPNTSPLYPVSYWKPKSNATPRARRRRFVFSRTFPDEPRRHR
mgnify:CR=1 FL=1